VCWVYFCSQPLYEKFVGGLYVLQPPLHAATTRFDCVIPFCGASAGEYPVSAPGKMGDDLTVLIWFRNSVKCRLLSPPDGRHPAVPNPKGTNYLLRTTAETIHSQVTCSSVPHWVADTPKIHEYFRLRNCRHRTTNASLRWRFKTLVTHLLKPVSTSTLPNWDTPTIIALAVVMIINLIQQWIFPCQYRHIKSWKVRHYPPINTEYQHSNWLPRIINDLNQLRQYDL
jgi:hypothetical protein